MAMMIWDRLRRLGSAPFRHRRELLTIDDDSDLALGQPDDALVEHDLVEAAVIDRLGAGWLGEVAIYLPLLHRLGPGIEVEGLLVVAESAPRGQNRRRHRTRGHGYQGRATSQGQWCGAVRLNLCCGNTLGNGTQKPGYLDTLRRGEPGRGITQPPVSLGDLDEAVDDELVDPGGRRIVSLQPCREERAQQVAVVADSPPGVEGRRVMSDDGRAGVEAETISCGHDVSDKPTQTAILVIAAGTIGFLDAAQRPLPAPVLQTSAGHGNYGATDGVGKDVGLYGQVRDAAAVVETPLQPVVSAAVRTDDDGRRQKDPDGVA